MTFPDKSFNDLIKVQPKTEPPSDHYQMKYDPNRKPLTYWHIGHDYLNGYMWVKNSLHIYFYELNNLNADPRNFDKLNIEEQKLIIDKILSRRAEEAERSRTFIDENPDFFKMDKIMMPIIGKNDNNKSN